MKTYKVVNHGYTLREKGELLIDQKEQPTLEKKYAVIKTGLSWVEAKELRKTNKNYQIVVER